MLPRHRLGLGFKPQRKPCNFGMVQFHSKIWGSGKKDVHVVILLAPHSLHSHYLCQDIQKFPDVLERGYLSTGGPVDKQSPVRNKSSLS